MISHHPPFEMIVDYATGALPAGVALVAATHAAMCPECRSAVEQLETLGGILVGDMEAEPLEGKLLTSVMDKLDEPEVPASANTRTLDAATRKLIPPPLRRYVTRSLKDLNWRSIAGVMKEARLAVRTRGVTVSLMHLPPGRAPKHGHYGHEYSLVLAGGYKDAGQQFLPGDFSMKDSGDVHQQVIDPDGGCICLVALDAPLRLTGLAGRLLNPFLRI